MSFSYSNISPILTVATIIGLYFLLGRLMSVEKSEYKTEKSFETLSAKYLVFDLKHLGIFLVMVGASGYLFYEIFLLFTGFRTSLLSDALIVVAPRIELLLMPSLFWALLSSSLLIVLLIKRQLKDDWKEYMAYYNLKYKFNYAKAAVYLTRTLAVITIVITIASLDWFSSFGHKEIKMNVFLSLGTKSYHYSDVSNVIAVMKVKAPNGNIRNEPYFLVTFNDGNKWSSRDHGFNDQQKNKEIIALVSKQSNKALSQVEFE
ncbi:hypothetical protein [Pedobacter sp. FW305-3-2-15-E-R2A2]|uniref:hypothetical protein n=1 Tax=Pedobacter sp. FW305-3-2-15-E-R2A2 TaxID=3140251 RepID=UPI00313FFCE1